MDKTIYSRERVLLAYLLTQARRSRGVRQAELAAKMALTQSDISKAESGMRFIEFAEVRHWLLALGMDLPTFVNFYEDELQRALRRERRLAHGIAHGDDATPKTSEISGPPTGKKRRRLPGMKQAPDLG